jgi:8-oxo-dGTP pyrophosphatase MutT (NUDIX family)
VSTVSLTSVDALPEEPGWLRPLARRAAAFDPGDLAFKLGRPAGLAGSPRRSAVLVLFGQAAGGDPDLLFVERAKTLRSHPGQPAFPGGKIDPGETAVQTALREAVEETGLEPGGVEVFGVLPELYLMPTDFLVTPVLAWWRAPSEVRVVDPREVASVRRIPVPELTDPANRFMVGHPSGRSGPGFAAGELLIWGFTAMLLDGVLRLGAWERPWDQTRTEPLPEEVVALSLRGRAVPPGGVTTAGPVDGSGNGENE